MEQINLDRYGFIKSVNMCIELLQEFGDKLTPEQLDEFLGEHTKEYMSSQEFIGLVVEAVIKGGDEFFDKMNALYEIKDEILKVIEPKNLIEIIEGQAQKVCEELVMQDSYINKLAEFCLSQARFRDYLFAYTKDVVREAISKMDIEIIVSDIVKENAEKYAQYLLETTKQKQLMAEASLFVIQTIEQLCLAKQQCWIDPDKLHPQGGSVTHRIQSNTTKENRDGKE